jgi:hypothetical protein
MATKYYIYSLSHSTDPSIGKYIGSTKNLRKRLATHKFECKLNSQNKLYKTIRETGGWDCWVFKTLETIYSDDPEDRRKAEQKHMDNQEVKINTYKAYCPCKKYYEEHRDEILDQKKVYYLKNREEIIKRKIQQRKELRLKKLDELAAQGLKPKRRSKNDPEEISPNEVSFRATYPINVEGEPCALSFRITYTTQREGETINLEEIKNAVINNITVTN